MLPGHYAKFYRNSLIETKAYWKIEQRMYRGSMNNAIADLREALGDAVRKRLVSDVEVGAFLSGGVDSSIMAAFAQKEHAQQLKTFTIGFESESYDERLFAKSVSKFFRYRSP